jgi:ABC-2 type transport system permease protein
LLSLSVIGMILAIVFVASQNVFDYQNLILIPVLLVCGVFVPVDSLPWIFKAVAYVIPMTWGIQGVYEALALSSQMFTTMIIAFLVSVVYFLLSVLIIKRMEMVLRNHGSLGAI